MHPRGWKSLGTGLDATEGAKVDGLVHLKMLSLSKTPTGFQQLGVDRQPHNEVEVVCTIAVSTVKYF